MEKLALLAAFVMDGARQNARDHLCADLLDAALVLDGTNVLVCELDHICLPERPKASDHNGMLRRTVLPRSRRCAPLSTRRWARVPLIVCVLSAQTPSQWIKAHCLGQ